MTNGTLERLKVGVVLDTTGKADAGGAFSFQSTLVRAIDEYSFSSSVEVVFVMLGASEPPFLSLKKPLIRINSSSARFKEISKKGIRFSFPRFLKRFSTAQKIVKAYRSLENAKAEKFLEKNGIEVLYYLSPFSTCLNFPFIINHWDVGHLSTHAFPEMTMNGNYLLREQYYLYTLNKAIFIFCESDAGARELLYHQRYFPQKVKVLPIFASSIIRLTVTKDHQKEVLSRYELKREQFFFYPAQFWSHKNHYNLLIAFKKFVSSPVRTLYQLVLCGSDKGNLAYLLEVIKELSLEPSVRVTGFISEQDLFSLYRNATAMVMPTFLGPTNMPLLEAAHLGCPVICSNLTGHKELLGEHAIYVEPHSTESIYDALEAVCHSGFNRYQKTADALEFVTCSPFTIENSIVQLNMLLTELSPIRKTWGLSNR